jgi:hypothetical protein
MLSSGANVIIWDEMLMELMLSSGVIMRFLFLFFLETSLTQKNAASDIEQVRLYKIFVVVKL